jgi:hypothetical protein
MELKVGDVVKYVDQKRRVRDALVTCIHMGGLANNIEEFKEKSGSFPCINVVVVMCEEDRKDPYGTQTEHASSVQYYNAASAAAGGFYYRFYSEDLTA